MLVILYFCTVVAADGTCLGGAAIRIRSDRWDSRPCTALCPPRLRPALVGCVKLRELRA